MHKMVAVSPSFELPSPKRRLDPHGRRYLYLSPRPEFMELLGLLTVLKTSAVSVIGDCELLLRA